MRFLRAAADGQAGFSNVAMLALAWVVMVIVSLFFLFLMVRAQDDGLFSSLSQLNHSLSGCVAVNAACFPSRWLVTQRPAFAAAQPSPFADSMVEHMRLSALGDWPAGQVFKKGKHQNHQLEAKY
eukprot:1155918-Pelagomonas_calceolata.AAC.9